MVPKLTNLNEDEEDYSNLNDCNRVIYNNVRSLDVSPDNYKHF
jgi:hypothetical protein